MMLRRFNCGRECESDEVAEANPDQMTNLKQVADEFRSELGDWSQSGVDRYASPYPSDLHAGWRGAAQLNASPNALEQSKK